MSYSNWKDRTGRCGIEWKGRTYLTGRTEPGFCGIGVIQIRRRRILVGGQNLWTSVTALMAWRRVCQGASEIRSLLRLPVCIQATDGALR